MQPGPAADDPACAQFIVDAGRNLRVLGGYDRVWTDAQATAAWGSPSAILLTCGAEPVVASSNPCQSIGGVDWVIDNSDPDHYLINTFGLTPTVELYLDLPALRERQAEDPSADADPSAVLGRVAKQLSGFERTGAGCTERP